MRLLSKNQKKYYIYVLLPFATRKKIRAQAKKDRGGPWLSRPEAH